MPPVLMALALPAVTTAPPEPEDVPDSESWDDLEDSPVALAHADALTRRTTTAVAAYGAICLRRDFIGVTFNQGPIAPAGSDRACPKEK
jgi:hypothetical protein